MERTPTDIDSSELPAPVASVLAGAALFDSSCSPTARTLLVVTGAGGRLFLKIERKGKLLRESAMSAFLGRFGIAPEVVLYESNNDQDYLLTEALDGEDGVSGGHLDDPARLAKVFGASLRVVHELPLDGCPLRGRSGEMIDEARRNARQSPGDLDIIGEGKEKALERMETLAHLAADEVVLHGDYCLPNIIMDRFRLVGFVDLGYGGVGDRHYDLFWGLWTLGHNLHTDRYGDLFLDAYGRDRLDADRIDLFRCVSGLTG